MKNKKQKRKEKRKTHKITEMCLYNPETNQIRYHRSIAYLFTGVA